VLTDAYQDYYVNNSTPPLAQLLGGVNGATQTGGAPGPLTYAWALVAPDHPNGASFVNPPGASSQRVMFAGPLGQSTFTQGVRVTVTDSAGNTSQETQPSVIQVIGIG
jgi:hypothetical protein